MLRFCCLGSGSAGNALVVEARDGLQVTRILVDDGFNPKQLGLRLARVGLTIAEIDAVFVTHEHSDHVGGVAGLLKRHPVPLHTSLGTAQTAGLAAHESLRPLADGATVAVGALSVRAYAVPHDAAEPLQLVFSDGARRLGLLTDIGMPTPEVAEALSGLEALILECNHDEAMLRDGAYPYFLKQRILGELGHLSNAQAALLLAQIDRSRLNRVVAAHLSQQNNRPDLAAAALAQVLACADEEIDVADQFAGLDWRVV